MAALYVHPKGCYVGLPDVDPWPESRDARLYAGPWPVVAHPPCARWCLLARFAEVRYGCKRGEDGGCFKAALAAVRRWGGVLEHPAWSSAWTAFGLPAPSPYGWQRDVEGAWVCQVEQGHYGHRAPKPTWLYAWGIEPPSLIWGPSEAREGIEKHLGHRARSATPVPFRDLLLSIARSAT